MKKYEIYFKSLITIFFPHIKTIKLLVFYLSLIFFSVSDCEKLSLPDSSVQLVTCSQAVHWFDTSKLFDEVKRILIPGGIIAIYGYWIPFPKTENSEKNKMLMNLIDEVILKPFQKMHLSNNEYLT